MVKSFALGLIVMIIATGLTGCESANSMSSSTPPAPKPTPSQIVQNNPKEAIRSYFNAAETDNVAELASWLNAGLPVDSTDSDGNTALFKASSEGHVMATKLLLERNANVNYQRNNGDTPLLAVVRTAHNTASLGFGYGMEKPQLVAIVRTLVDAGADVTEVKKYAGAKRKLRINDGVPLEYNTLPEDVRVILTSAESKR